MNLLDSGFHCHSLLGLRFKRTVVQNTTHLFRKNNIHWSALFLLPGSNYLAPTPCFCQFFQTCLESLSLFKNLFFSPIALRCVCTYECMCVCVCVCVCVHACVRLCMCSFMSVLNTIHPPSVFLTRFNAQPINTFL